MNDIAQGFVGSFTLGAGQFCTKPGLLLAPRGFGASVAVAAALDQASPHAVMLTESIANGVDAGVSAMQEAGATVVCASEGLAEGWSAPVVVLSAAASDLVQGSRLLEECFGPVALVVEYDGVAEAERLLDNLQGALAGSVMMAEDDPDGARVVGRLRRRVGRVIINDWPTGVAFTWAQQHGGPWPATSDPGSTSVGAAALNRFVRPVAYQGAPDARSCLRHCRPTTPGVLFGASTAG